MGDMDLIKEIKLINNMLEGKFDLPIVNDVEGLENECAE